MTSENNVVAFLKQELGKDLIEVTSPRQRRVFARITSPALRKAVSCMKDHYQTLRFMTLSTVDHGLDMEFLHHFHVDGIVVTLRSLTRKEDNTLESIADLIPAANFIERETADLFGVRLTNSPQSKPLILPEEWPNDKRPLRKPLEGELPLQARPTAEALISTSCVAPVSTFIQKKREEAGLPRAPSFAFTDEKTMHEFQGIMEETGLNQKAGYDKEKKRLRYK